MKARYLIFLGLFSIALAGMTSCSDAIFATVETATKTATNTLSLTLNVYDIAVIPPVPPGGVYSVAAGAVFNGTLSGAYPGTVSWTPNINNNGRPNNPSNTACNALTYFPGFLYGGFVTSSGTGSLWKSDGTYSFGPGHGVQMTTAVPNEQVTMLRSTSNNRLFMGGALSTGNGFVYELDLWNGSSWQPVIQNLTDPITGVGFDGTNYWVASSAIGLPGTSINRPAYIYTTSTDPPTLGSFVQYSNNPVSSGDQINSLFTDGTNGYTFITTRAEGIFYTNHGTGWVPFTPDHENGSTPVSYLCVGGPVGTDGVALNDIYLAGSDGYGYYTLSTGTNGGMTRYSNTTIILYTSSISRIAVDGGGLPAYSNVLMGTNANGLWRGVFDTTGNLASGQSWVQE